MKNFVGHYQTLLGCLLICLTLLVVSGKGGNVAALFSSAAYAAATDVVGSPNVVVAAFPVKKSDGTPAVLIVMSNGELRVSTGTSASSTKSLSDTTKLGDTNLMTGTSGLKFISGGRAAVHVLAGTAYAVGSDGVLYYMNLTSGGWNALNASVLP